MHKVTYVISVLLLGICILHVATAKQNRNKSCRYSRKTMGVCDPNSNTRVLTKTLKSGPGSECAPKKTKIIKCQADVPTCRYKRTHWSECDVNKNEITRTRQLKHLSDETCPEQMIETKPCHQGKTKNKCKYLKSAWSMCESNRQVRTMTLKVSNSGSDCETTKTKTRSC